ncbi:hypothetical protein J4E83_006457 [Alternaria metachromatica]|uniref:uncharacterized protein n=1 Tax=Alternaria metachromatica TaxID=283354 RepID=UPI0020C4E5F8|nr:uncharacterized protein J4E83_006457 [Alternaria metachromatica]KAI4616875.1 hypothetical protein J4E83_006457 [Alternaria metachromatica]
MTRIIEASQGEVVAIAIGPSKTIFRIHESLLCSKSEYFRTAYNGRWKDSTDGVVLEDVDVGVFKLFVNWLYTSKVPENFDDLSTMTGMPQCVSGESTTAAFLLLKACVFGDRFLAYDFYERAHNTFVDWNVLNPGWPWVDLGDGRLRVRESSG